MSEHNREDTDMISNMEPVQSGMTGSPRIGEHPPLLPKAMKVASKTDRLELGQSGSVNNDQAMSMVLERAMEKLRSVVDQARTELGLPEGAELDTSPDATAGRIVEFALNFFEKYAERNGLEDNEEGRTAYVEFISKAVYQGIDEARGILSALNALNPEISGNIDKTTDIIDQQFENFIVNGRS